MKTAPNNGLILTAVVFYEALKHLDQARISPFFGQSKKSILEYLQRYTTGSQAQSSLTEEFYETFEQEFTLFEDKHAQLWLDSKARANFAPTISSVSSILLAKAAVINFLITQVILHLPLTQKLSLNKSEILNLAYQTFLQKYDIKDGSKKYQFSQRINHLKTFFLWSTYLSISAFLIRQIVQSLQTDSSNNNPSTFAPTETPTVLPSLPVIEVLYNYTVTLWERPSISPFNHMIQYTAPAPCHDGPCCGGPGIAGVNVFRGLYSAGNSSALTEFYFETGYFSGNISEYFFNSPAYPLNRTFSLPYSQGLRNLARFASGLLCIDIGNNLFAGNNSYSFGFAPNNTGNYTDVFSVSENLIPTFAPTTSIPTPTSIYIIPSATPTDGNTTLPFTLYLIFTLLHILVSPIFLLFISRQINQYIERRNPIHQAENIVDYVCYLFGNPASEQNTHAPVPGAHIIEMDELPRSAAQTGASPS